MSTRTKWRLMKWIGLVGNVASIAQLFYMLFR